MSSFFSSDGRILSECVSSQRTTQFGGVIPSFAMGFHARELPRVVGKVVADSGLSLDCGGGIEAVAVTNRPGLSGSLDVGTSYAKYLSLKHGVPLIPIHHMEAHALTARMIEKVNT